MTEADVINLINYGDSIGRDINDFRAVTVLGAREILAGDPKNAHALAVVNDFADFLRTGEYGHRFEWFMLPKFETDEEIAERAAYRAAHPDAVATIHSVSADRLCWHFCRACKSDFFHLIDANSPVLDEYFQNCPTCIAAGKTVAQSKVKAVAAHAANEGVPTGELAEKLSETNTDDGGLRAASLGAAGRSWTLASEQEDNLPLVSFLHDGDEQ